jgi:cytochrome P450
MKGWADYSQCGSYPIIHELHLDKMIFPGLTAGTKRFVEYGRTQASARMAKQADDKTERRDIFYYLLNSKDSETDNGFTIPEIWAEANLLIVAGSDTTSTALAATLFYLLNNPNCLQRLTKEVLNTFDGVDVEDIRSGALLNSCTYLRACIDEALRLSPPVPGYLPREVQSGGAIIDGQSIPAGTVVGIAAYSIHHNPKYYPEPFSYIPDRWLRTRECQSPEISKVSVETVQSAFCPFSIGPRGCLGKPMAYLELTTALARTVYSFDLKLASTLGGGSPIGGWGRRRSTEYQLEDTFTSRKDGPMVEFKYRKV